MTTYILVSDPADIMGRNGGHWRPVQANGDSGQGKVIKQPFLR
jgi:hypothetical protein